MDFHHQINNEKFLFLTKIFEPEENTLRLELAIGETDSYKKHEVSGIKFAASRIFHHQKSRKFNIDFLSYIAYSVIDESYDNLQGTDFTGNRLRTYQTSNFLDYIKKDTIASSDYPGAFQHYAFLFEDHVVNVISTLEPRISILK